MPTALVTGANKGLGRETARQLGELGHYVYLGSRDVARADDALAELHDAGGAGEVLALDVAHAEGVAAAVARITEAGRGLDVLVNNAGHIVEASAAETTAAVMRAVFDTNVFGAVEVTTACLPLLTASPAPRVVNVTSTTASLTLSASGHDFGGNAETRMAYATSKTALNMVTVQLAAALAADPDRRHIKVNSATPGFMATDINGHRGTRSVADGARVIVDLATLPDDGPTGGFFNDRGEVPW